MTLQCTCEIEIKIPSITYCAQQTKHIWIYKYNNNHQKGSRDDMTLVYNNL